MYKSGSSLKMKCFHLDASLWFIPISVIKLYEMFLQFLLCVGNFFGSAQDSEWKDYQTGAKKGKENDCPIGSVAFATDSWSCSRIFSTNLSLQLRPRFYLHN